MNDTFSLIKTGRQRLLNTVETLPFQTVKTIPNGFRNNILWNIGHLTVATPFLTRVQSNLPINVPEPLLARFRKGTFPIEDETEATFNEIKTLFISTIDALQNDYQHNAFAKTTFNAYETSYGVTLTSIENAIRFTIAHDNLHFGIVRTYIKLLAPTERA